MPRSSLSKIVRVLLIVAGIVTILGGFYSIKLERSLVHAERMPSRELPSDLNKLTRDELLSLQKSFKEQTEARQEAYNHDDEVYKQKSTAAFLMICSGVVMLILSIINYYLLRKQGTRAGTNISPDISA